MGEVAKQVSTKVLIHVINKVTNELKRLRFDKRMYDFNKDDYIYMYYFVEGKLRLSKYTIIYEEDYINKLELAYDEVMLNGIKYPIGDCGTEVTTLLEKCIKEVYDLYKGLITLNIGVEREQ